MGSGQRKTRRRKAIALKEVNVAMEIDDEEIEPAARELQPMLEKERKRCLQWYYDFGQVVAKHYFAVKEERERLGNTMYGERFFERLAHRLHIERPELLRDCFRLVNAYDEDDYRKLCRHNHVKVSHVMQLAKIGQEDARNELQTAAISEQMTVKELVQAAKEKLGYRHQPGAGRPFKVPKSVKAAVTHMLSQAAKFDKLHREAWFGDAFDLREEVREIPANKLTEEFKESISQTADAFDQLAESTVQNAQVLREVVSNVEQRMQAQAELNRRVEEEAELCTAG